MVKIRFSQKRYFNMFIIVLALIAFLAYQDIIGAHMWGLLGGWESEAYATAKPIYMRQFWTFAILLGAVISFVYYLFRKDKSEAVAIFSAYIIMILAGLEDLLFYLFKGIPLDLSMPWLYNGIFVGTVAKVMSLKTVTPFSLMISIILGFGLSYLIFKKLKEAKW